MGTRLETVERFYGLRTTLRFETIVVGEMGFRLDLKSPIPSLWCAFVLAPEDGERTCLSLFVGSRARSGKVLLRLPLIRGAVQRQIQSEVDHIARSMEETQGGRGKVE